MRWDPTTSINNRLAVIYIYVPRIKIPGAKEGLPVKT